MRVVWDPVKAAINLSKHGVRFTEAEEVLNDSLAVTIEDTRFSEQRFISIGMDLEHRLLVVVYAYPFERDEVRIISARLATSAERETYFGRDT